MPCRNYALEWYTYGRNNNYDEIIKFMMHWIAFNWLYSGYQRYNETSEAEAIKIYCEENYDKLSRFNAFESPAINIFKEAPVADARYGGVTKKGRERFKALCEEDGLEQLTSLMLTLYQVRCNLFHGSKSLMIERDVELIKSSSVILEEYLGTVLLVK